MNTVLYVALGFLDIVVVFAFLFKIYRWPFWGYAKEIAAIALALSLISWVDRVLLPLADWDATIQYGLVILSLRLLFGVRWNRAFTLATVGYLAFVSTQNVVYALLLAANMVSMADAQITQGAGTYLIQICTHVVSFLICLALYYGGYGFSYISVPPHDRKKESTSNVQRAISALNVVAALVLASTMYWVMNYYQHVYIIVPSALLALFLLIVLSRKRENAQ